MKKTSYFAAIFCLFIFTLNSYAQKERPDTVRAIAKNWFVSARAGTQILFATDASKLGFADRLSPDLVLIAGKWVTPSVGFRLRFNGYRLNGLSTTKGIYLADPVDGNRMYGNDDPVRNYSEIRPDGSYRHDVYYLNSAIDLQVSLMNVFNLAGENMKWDIIPAAGIGYMHVFDYEGTPAANLVSANVAITGSYRLNSRLDINAGLHTAFFSDQFDGRITGRSEEGNMGLTAGLTFHIGRHGFKKQRGVMPVSAVKTDTIVLPPEIDTVYVEKKVEIIKQPSGYKPFALCSILFDINSMAPKAGQEPLLINIADFLKKNPDHKIRLDAYTDSETGSEIYNSSLARGRAAYIKGLLVNDEGVDPSLVEENPVGIASQPYRKSEYNRVVVVTVLAGN